MTPTEVKVAMERLATNQLESSVSGVHWSSVLRDFRQIYSKLLPGLATSALDDWLRRCATDVVRSLRRTDNAQLVLPGFGAIDATVTTTDGEGGFVVKRIKFATADDLVQDEGIHEQNVEAATKALDRAHRRNHVLLPIMQSEGFVTAGEALEYLGDPAS